MKRRTIGEGLKTFIVAVWVIVAASSTLVTSAATKSTTTPAKQPTTSTSPAKSTSKKSTPTKSSTKPKPRKKYVCETKTVGKRQKKVCRWETVQETPAPATATIQTLPGPQLSICPSWTATLCRIVPGITIMDGAESGGGSSTSSESSTGSSGSGSTTGGSSGGSGSGGPTLSAPPSTNSAVDATVPCTSNPNPEFTADITDLSLITYIVPPGIATGNEIKPHTFLGIDTSKTEKVPVYVPTEVDLITGSYALNNEQADYGFTFQVSCEVWFNFGHITDPIDEIKKLLPSTPASTSQTSGPFNPILRLSAGQQIGYTRGTKQNRNFDFGVYNSTSIHQFANSERYQNSIKRKTSVCPYRFYPSGKRASYEAKYGDFSPMSVANCRSSNQDKAGTLAGAWFNTPVSEGTEVSGRFAIAKTLDSNYIRIVGLGSAMFVGNSNSTFKEPEAITDQHCYNVGDRYLFFKLASSTAVRVVDSTGSCPGTFPEGGFSTYNR